MSNTSAIASPAEGTDAHEGAGADQRDLSILRAQRRLRMLEELAEIGMNLARALPRVAEAGAASEGAAPGRDPADAFARLSRAIRFTLALETRTDAALRALIADTAAERETHRVETARRAEAAAAEHRQAREDKVDKLVRDVIIAEAEHTEAFEGLGAALEERLEQDEAYEGLADLPLRETVERLCADLELTPDWSRWTGEGWAVKEPFARSPRSPFRQPRRTPDRWDRVTPERRAAIENRDWTWLNPGAPSLE